MAPATAAALGPAVAKYVAPVAVAPNAGEQKVAAVGLILLKPIFSSNSNYT